jgi:arabinofuranan 3-O-arabinosyltransferase
MDPLRALGPGLRGRLPSRPRLTAGLWVLAVVACAQLVLRSYLEDRYIVDFRALQDGAMRFWDGASVYADPWFLLTPSGLLAMLPFGAVGPFTGFVLWNTASIGAAAAGIVCALRLVGARLSGGVAAATVGAVCVGESLTSTLLLGNLNNSLLLALGAGFLLAGVRGRRVLAGVLLGLSLAVKPVLVLLLLLPLLRRAWPTLGWALALPASLNLVGLVLVPVRSDFLAVTVPNLLRARVEWNSSLWAVGTHAGVPGPVLTVARLLVIVLAVVAVRRLRYVEDAVLRDATSYGVLLLATFLAGSLSQAYYSLFLVPLLLTVTRAGSALRTPAAWVAVGLSMGPRTPTVPGSAEVTEVVDLLRWTTGWIVLFAVLVSWALRQAPPGGPAASEEPGGQDPAHTVGTTVPAEERTVAGAGV